MTSLMKRKERKGSDWPEFLSIRWQEHISQFRFDGRKTSLEPVGPSLPARPPPSPPPAPLFPFSYFSKTSAFELLFTTLPQYDSKFWVQRLCWAPSNCLFGINVTFCLKQSVLAWTESTLSRQRVIYARQSVLKEFIVVFISNVLKTIMDSKNVAFNF